MELPGSKDKKIEKEKNGENISRLEITEVLLVHCSVVSNGYH